MGRLRLLNPNNYQSSGNINADFENIVRYLVASERGTKTLGEMLSSIFDEDGDFAGAVELRLDQSEGIQYRVGNFTDAEEGWTTIIDLEDLRGSSGVSIGTIILPIITGRIDYDGDDATTDFAYVYSADDMVLVYINGVLQREGALYDYTLSDDEVNFNSAPSSSDSISIFKVRGDDSISSTRVDTTPVSTQTVFAYVFPEAAYELYIYKNGVLLREGALNDYILSPSTNTITFIDSVLSTDTVAFITIESTAQNVATGLMLEEEFVDGATGQILWSKIGVSDGAIPQAKVSSLSTDLAARAVITVASSAPVSPSTGALWLDTSVSPNVLSFFDGVGWNATSPENAIPDFDTSNAGQYVKVNSSGSGLEIDDIDLSGLVPTTQKGSANGVASLDANGQLPEAQMPEVRATENFYYFKSGAVSNGTYVMNRTYKQLIRITGLSALLTSGSCQIQLSVAGVAVGPTYAVSSTALDQPLATLIEIDSLAASKAIAVIVTSASSAQDLNITLAIELLE